MIKRLIFFLVRVRLGLKKYEAFQFTNQKSADAVYYFNSDAILKVHNWETTKSHVSLNWLLDDDCKIKKV